MIEPQLRELYDSAWRELEAAVDDAEDGFHWPVVSTIDLDGTPSTRTVVLRAADAASSTLRFHTDRRAPKVAQLRKLDCVGVHFFCRERMRQLRVRATAYLHETGAVADADWARLPVTSRKCYLAPLAPTCATDQWTANLPADLVAGQLPDLARTELGRANFCVVRLSVHAIDVLQIRRAGHSRASFTCDEGRLAAASWLTP